ncbi:MAG: ATP-dependent Clp protease ATP-binding subunit [Erysipelotrichaceae bacterium]|nr:ATP-dependent Clp protease ATP-binding subunit [Erysipelotrichaceae bacterium]
MLSSFSLCSKKIMSIAESIAYDLGHINVGSEHLLLSLAKNKNYCFKNILENKGITYSKIREKVLKINPIKSLKPVYMEYSDHLKKIIDSALEESQKNNEKQIEIERLTKAMLSDMDSFAVQIIMEMNGDVEEIKKEVEENSSDLGENIEDLINLNKKVIKKDSKLIGRDKEIEEIQDVLLKKNKRNIILIGEPGVGKTAIIEELAKRINNKEVKHDLENKIIYQMNISDIVAGTKYRGEFEEKLKKIIKKIKNKKDVILFIDEIHSIVGAGGAEGAIDASNILKPYLSSGEINCIGATTFDEYEKSIEKEKAFQRRFQTIKILESSVKETINILIKTKEDYENFHKIKIDDESIVDIVNYSNDYILNRMLPDKAIDLLDVLCVKAKNDDNNLDKNVTKKYLKSLLKGFLNEENINVISENLRSKYSLENVNQLVDCLKGIKRNKEKPLLSVVLVNNNESDIINDLSKCLENYNYLKIDLKEFSDSISSSKLLGAMPGYVGYEQRNTFDSVVKNPNSLVLFKNYEYGSNNVKDIIKSIISQGIVIDNAQRKIDFRNCLVFIETLSNSSNGFGFVVNDNKNSYEIKTDYVINLTK